MSPDTQVPLGAPPSGPPPEVNFGATFRGAAPMKPDGRDWPAAQAHFNASRHPLLDRNDQREDCEKEIAERYMPLIKRFLKGERTQELYEAMLALPKRT